VRPKSTEFVGFKCPLELKTDALELARYGGLTEAEVWKGAMEFRLTILLGLRADYYRLRETYPLTQVQQGSTNGDGVKPER